MTLEQIAEQIRGLSEKMDAIIAPMKQDVSDLKGKVDRHSEEIVTLKEFKEGHQREHEENIARRRFNWEIIAGSGIIGAVMVWLSNMGGK